MLVQPGWASVHLHSCMQPEACSTASRPWMPCRSAAKEQAAGGACARVSFAEVDALIYDTLKVPHSQLELLGVQRVRLGAPGSLPCRSTRSKLYAKLLTFSGSLQSSHLDRACSGAPLWPGCANP